MSKVGKIITMALVVTIVLMLGISGAALAYNPDSPGPEYSPGPAPNSGLDLHDGPGWGDDRPDGSGRGPAPNSGSGDHLGPGWPAE